MANSEINMPSVFLIGVPKAGTSKIAEVLAHSKGFSIGKIKEPKYFTNITNSYSLAGKNDKKTHLGKPTTLKDYLQCYDSRGENKKILVDCSSDYFRFCHLVVPEIKKLCTDPRFIVVLRNPIDRCYSQYLNTKALGREILTFQQAIQKEGERINLGWGPAFHYVHDSCYSDSLRWLKDNNVSLKVYIYEEVFESEVAFRQFFFDAFGEKIVVDMSRRSNSTGHPVPYVFDLFRAIWGMVPEGIQDNSQIKKMKQYTRSVLLREKQSLPFDDRKFLHSLFKEDMSKTYEILGREIKSWELS